MPSKLIEIFSLLKIQKICMIGRIHLIFRDTQTIDLLHLILDKISGIPIPRISLIGVLGRMFSKKKYSLVFIIFFFKRVISEIFFDLKKPSIAF